MRWLLENPQLLFIVGGAIAFWLNQRRKEKQNREIEQELAREPTEDEMAERTRRIQEEIRRKIAERQGQAMPPPLAPVETVRREALPELPATPPPLPTARPLVVSMEDSPGAAELERVMDEQRSYAEQLDRLAAAERKRAASDPALPTPISMAAYAVAEAAAASPVRAPRRTDGIFALVHDRDSLRRAIVLREVLGAPKALS